MDGDTFGAWHWWAQGVPAVATLGLGMRWEVLAPAISTLGRGHRAEDCSQPDKCGSIRALGRSKRAGDGVDPKARAAH